MKKLLSSMALNIMRRAPVYVDVLRGEGERTMKAARFLVAIEMAEITKPPKQLKLTQAGHDALAEHEEKNDELEA